MLAHTSARQQQQQHGAVTQQAAAREGNGPDVSTKSGERGSGAPAASLRTCVHHIGPLHRLERIVAAGGQGGRHVE